MASGSSSAEMSTSAQAHFGGRIARRRTWGYTESPPRFQRLQTNNQGTTAWACGPDAGQSSYWNQKAEIHMARKPSNFRQADLTKVLKAMRAAGFEPYIDLRDGGISIRPIDPAKPDESPQSELDRWLGKRGHANADAT